MKDINATFEKLQALKANIRIALKESGILQVIFPVWNELGLLGKVFRQCVRTKESPDGQLYDEATYRTVLRILKGKVYMTNSMADSYAWTQETFYEKAVNAIPCGTHTAQGILGMCKLLSAIISDKERLEVAEMFASWNKDLILVEAAPERRQVVEITQELYDAGITTCIDGWRKPDENGEYKETQLNVGDFLVVNSEKRTVYCIRRAEFFASHKLEA